MKIQTREALQQLRAAAQATIDNYSCRILVCAGTGCIATGSQKIYDKMVDIARDYPNVTVEFKPHDADAHPIGIKRTGCQGICELGPLVRIQKGDKVIQLVRVKEEDCQEVFERCVLGDEVLDHHTYCQNGKFYPKPEEIPFMAKQTRIALENCGKLDAESLEEYIAAGGFSALEKALFEMQPSDVVDTVDAAELRGRGGGGYPAGRKWKQVMRQKETTRYVVCNGDEGDPGAFMDGSVMEGDPFRLIEGMMLAAYAVSSKDGYIYVRAEYPNSVART